MKGVGSKLEAPVFEISKSISGKNASRKDNFMFSFPTIFSGTRFDRFPERLSRVALFSAIDPNYASSLDSISLGFNGKTGEGREGGDMA